MRFFRSTYLVICLSLETDRPNELCCKFAISNDLSIRWLTILLGSLIVALTFLLFFIYFLLTPLVNSDHVVVSVSIDFLSNSKRDALFH